LLTPLALAFALGWSAADLGLSRPRLDRGSLLFILACVILICGVIPVIRLAPDYLARYATWRNAAVPLAVRLEQFSLFTISSLLGWEFLHRGFLLFGLRRACAMGGIPEDLSRHMAVCVTATFEVLFHFTKPGMEAAGMLLASPLLSIAAFRTGSLWVPLGLHLMIEGLFFLVISS
ncbi:MAG: CPBP family glutamic-type intramembrane protease, partial [Candidatus Hydrogenedentota bacterium]